MRIYCEVYAHLYVVNTVLAMVYLRHASHLQAQEWNGGHFVYSKLIVKMPYSRRLAFLKYALKYTWHEEAGMRTE